MFDTFGSIISNGSKIIGAASSLFADKGKSSGGTGALNTPVSPGGLES